MAFQGNPVDHAQGIPPRQTNIIPYQLRRVGPRVKAPVSRLLNQGREVPSQPWLSRCLLLSVLLGSKEASEPDRRRVELSISLSFSLLDRLANVCTKSIWLKHSLCRGTTPDLLHGLYTGQSSRTTFSESLRCFLTHRCFSVSLLELCSNGKLTVTFGPKQERHPGHAVFYTAFFLLWRRETTALYLCLSDRLCLQSHEAQLKQRGKKEVHGDWSTVVHISCSSS